MLNVSGNNLESLRDLENLRCLTQLIANDNHLTDMRELAHVLSGWKSLWRLELMGNPICHKSKYRDRIIIMSPKLGMFTKSCVRDETCTLCLGWTEKN